MLTDPVNSPPPENVPDTGSVSEACAVKDGSAAAGIAATSDNVIASPATLQNTVFIGSPCLSGPPEIRRHARGDASARPRTKEIDHSSTDGFMIRRRVRARMLLRSTPAPNPRPTTRAPRGLPARSRDRFAARDQMYQLVQTPTSQSRRHPAPIFRNCGRRNVGHPAFERA